MSSIRIEKPKTLSELRSFGLTMALILGGISIYTLFNQSQLGLLWITVTVFFGTLGLLAPAALRPIEKGWIKLGELMGMVVTPIVMGVMFFGIITPIGLLMRAIGKDLLDQKIDKGATTHWKKTEPITDKSRYFTPY